MVELAWGRSQLPALTNLAPFPAAQPRTGLQPSTLCPQAALGAPVSSLTPDFGCENQVLFENSLCLTKNCKVSCVYLPLNLWGSRVNEFPCILSYELYLWLCIFNIVYQCWKASIKINNWEFKWGCLPRSALRLCSLLWGWSYISFWSKLMLLNKNLERIIKNISFTHLWIFSWNPLNNSFDGQWIISHQECQTVQGPCMSCNCRQF